MKTSSVGKAGTGSQKFALTCAVSFSKGGTGTGPPGTVSGIEAGPEFAPKPDSAEAEVLGVVLLEDGVLEVVELPGFLGTKTW